MSFYYKTIFMIVSFHQHLKNIVEMSVDSVIKYIMKMKKKRIKLSVFSALLAHTVCKMRVGCVRIYLRGE